MKNKLMAIAPVTMMLAAGLTQTAHAGAVVIEPGEMVGSVMVADRFGVKPEVVIGARFGGTTSIYDTAPAFAISAYSRRTPRDIWAYRQRGYGWDKTAAWAGVSVSTYNSLYSNHQFDPDWVWANDFSDRYGFTQADAMAMRRMGYSWRQIAQAAIVSQDTQEPISVILLRARNSRAYYPTNWRYRAAPIYVPPRFNNSIWLPQRPSYATWWNRPSNGLSVYWTSSGGFGLSLNFASTRRQVYSCWSPRPIFRGYPYRPIVIARPPRQYRPPVILINRPVNNTKVTININTRKKEADQRWSQARERTVREQKVAVQENKKGKSFKDINPDEVKKKADANHKPGATKPLDKKNPVNNATDKKNKPGNPKVDKTKKPVRTS